MTKSDPTEAQEAQRQAREQRLAKALRENLRRRKAPPSPSESPEKPRG
jgi:hypothetical protein